LAKLLEQIEKLRDRFSAWGVALASVCIVAAVWVTAPTLEVKLPLASESEVTLNVGYVLAIAMPVITVAYAWILGALVTMRRYQSAALSASRESSNAAATAIRVQGSLLPRMARTRFERIVVVVVLAIRLLILFAVPPLAEVWIGVRYFTDLQVYPEEKIDDQRRVLVGEHVLGLGAFGASVPKKPRFAITNGDLADACRDHWEKKVSASEKCVLDQFPRFVLPLTSYLNLVSFLAITVLALFGVRAYLVPPTTPRPSTVDARR
jgi:hypothetical protein